MARGVTIIEILVVLAIFAIISGVVFFNFRGFNDVMYLERLTHDIASQIEEAKRAAISGEDPASFSGICSSTSKPCKPSYGVHFDQSASPNIISYFRDQDNNSSFDDPNELIRAFNPPTGYSIEDICFDGNAVCPSNELTVVFTRPFPDAALSSPSGPISNMAEIKVISPDGYKRTIAVYITGQVSVR
ncbi:hypothetical protein A3I25_02050 [Candidatus Nomurabacteria bacterium RIFCSPLOWO2_02_FULL_42_17]|uniref:General secretion pathway GspH domain-containing protein n=2 Tax=Candidatus Nomuraibacteriota TaxID=1752729 RepID=A0A1F6WLS9_9BACT|nr:MAG: hypothetical protein UV08_C0006G0015 [Parcubacteria group bacterium GW2011_GWA2_42_18]OGI82872.1 MAG: hypothetical protein A3B93_02250 [Candidatus Nomurabacteria bacterium RIFCSPHIGHO2_02_FULL_42_24]OGI97094.1 MAG: hypothetical protein A3I25_02050 [Candidatus Nomurabacteria bacterium RIFCSPLOWO2_02_FULL_42_17]